MKEIKFHYITCLAGIVCVFVALLSGVTIQGNAVQIGSLSARIALGAFGAVLLVVSVVAEVRAVTQRSASERTPTKGTGTDSNKATAIVKPPVDNVFFTANSTSERDTLHGLTEHAHTVWILARTAVNLLNLCEAQIVGLTKRGCKVHFLFTDPQSDASRYLYGGEDEIYHSNITTTARHIAAISKAVLPGHFEVRVMPHAPTMSIIFAEHDDESRNVLRVTLYFIHHVFGNDRPMFVVHNNDQWFKPFRSELMELWNRGTPWTTDSITSRK